MGGPGGSPPPPGPPPPPWAGKGLGDQERDRESDAGDERDPDDIGPRDGRIQPRPAQARHEPGGPRAELSFAGDPSLDGAAKVAILTGSTLAALAGGSFLALRSKRRARWEMHSGDGTAR